MLPCPNCSQQMNVRNVDNVMVLHCGTCGSSFFDADDVAKISKQSARKLAEEAQGSYVLGSTKLCPKDKSELSEIYEGVPKNTVILKCPTCNGIFAFPDDLLKYKGVKDPEPMAASQFHLLPAPRSLLMLGTFAVLTLATLLNLPTLSTQFSSQTRANDVVKSAVFSTDTTKRMLFAYFKSQTPVKTTIVIRDKETNRIVTKEISPEPQTIHQLTTSEVDTSHSLTYSLIITEPSGSQIKTVEKPIVLKR